MSGSSTPNLGLPYVVPNQSQPSIPINTAFDILDAAVGGVGVSIAVKEVGDSPAGDVPHCKTLRIAGATVTPESDDTALVTIPAGSMTVEDLSVSPHVTIDDVSTIRFSGSGVAVSAGSDGVAHVAISGGGGGGSDNEPPQKCFFQIACSDLVTSLSTGTSVGYFRAPHAFTIDAVRSSVLVDSSSGNPTVNIKRNGTTILSTQLSIDSGENTSTTAATPAVISDAEVNDDDAITVDITTAGTGTKGLIVSLIGHF